MADIKKSINADEPVHSEAAEHLLDLEEWDEAIAADKAAAEGIELSDEHWRVLRFLRQHYVEHGPVKARRLSAALDERFADRGGRRYLYRLFPDGPVNQGSRIAGLPPPEDSVDPSFGSAF